LVDAVKERRAAVALLAALSLGACGGDVDFGTAHDPAAGTGGATVAASALAFEEDGREPRTLFVRPRGEILLRFTAPLEEESAERSVRVEDETRGGAPVAVEARVRGRDLALRPRDAAGWRPGALLSVRVAGLPSLRSLRGADGVALGSEATVRVAVRSPRRTDRVSPRIVSTEPAPGSEGVDPEAAMAVRFSEPMDVRALTLAAAGGEEGLAATLLVDSLPVAFRSHLDRDRRLLTVLPASPFPPGARVVLSLGERARDAAGNALDPASPRQLAFAVAPRPAARGRVVEAFEDAGFLDPLGTTVRWNDPASPGVLEGVIEPRALESGAGVAESALLLDPRGGTLRTFVPAADLGDEARVLKGLVLVPAPGGTTGELLEPRVRVAEASSLLAGGPEGEFAWVDATGPLRGVSPRGPDGVLALPFRHPFAWKGGAGVAVEVSWSGVAGSVVLRAGSHDSPRTLLQGVEPLPAALRLAPILRLEAVGERAVARSAWRDSGAAAPSWQEPRVEPAAAPGACRVEFQGAPGGADGASPDPSRASAWTQDPAALEGLRWVRFRVLFEGAEPAAIDELTIPFVGR
jgi:hypothetical protein